MENKDINIQKDEPDAFKYIIKRKIVFAKLNKYFLLPFLDPIFCLIDTYLLSKLAKSNIKRKEFLILMMAGLSFIFAGFLFFVLNHKSKKIKK